MEASPESDPRRSGGDTAAGRLRSMQPDALLCALASRGNEDAFVALYNRYRQPVFAFVYHLLGASSTVQDAEDLTQEIFQKAYANMGSRKPHGTFKSWLFRIARNHTFDHIRLRRPAALSIDDPDRAAEPSNVVSLHQQVERREELEWLVGAMGTLPERQRAALVMRELGGMSYDEIAESLATNREGVKQLIKRGRATVNAAAVAGGHRSRGLGRDLAAAAPITAVAWLGAGHASAAAAGATAAGAAGAGLAAGGAGVAASTGAAASTGLAIGAGKIAATVLAVTAIGVGGVTVSEQLDPTSTTQQVSGDGSSGNKSTPAVPERSTVLGAGASEVAVAKKQASNRRRELARERARKRRGGSAGNSAPGRSRSSTRGNRAKSQSRPQRAKSRPSPGASGGSGGRSGGGSGSGNSGASNGKQSTGGSQQQGSANAGGGNGQGKKSQ